MRSWQIWVLAVALLVLGLALSVGPAEEAEDARRLEAVGVSTTATVDDVIVRDLGRRLGDEVRLSVSFENEFGATERTTEIYCREPNEIAPGDEVEVLYDPDDPDLLHFEGCVYDTDATIVQIIGVVVLAGAVFVLLSAWRHARWRFGWWGIAIALIGAVFVGAAFDPSCECRSMLYFGLSLSLVGIGGAIGRITAGKIDDAAST